MSHHARRHPVATFLVILVFGPFIGAAILLYVLVFAAAVLFDALYRPR